MDKRFRKMENLKFNTPVYKMLSMKKQTYCLLDLTQLVVRIEEAMTRLEQEGMKVNHAHVRLIHPFPTAEIDPLVKRRSVL